MDVRLVPFLDSFRRAAAFIEAPEITGDLDNPDLARSIARLALLWGARQLKAISLLLEQGFDLEAEPVVRALLEMAINTAWVGKDVDRAEQLRDDGLDSLLTWVKAMSTESPGFFPPEVLMSVEKLVGESTAKSDKLPRLMKRAADAAAVGFKPGLTMRAYHFSYRRLSAPVHGDSRLFEMLIHRPDYLAVLDARDAAISAAILFASAGDCLLLSLPILIAKDLCTVADESLAAGRKA